MTDSSSSLGEEVLAEISDAVYEGNRNDIAEMTRRALNSAVTAEDVLRRGLNPGMQRVGEEFRDGLMFIPEVLMSAQTMHASMELLKPIFSDSNLENVGTLLLGTMEGDIHDIGKNLVGMMCEGTGFRVVDLGVNVAPETFVEAVERESPDIVGLSALLTTTTRCMKVTIEALDEAGLRGSVKVIVGGAPVTDEFSEEIGADGYAPNATEAADLARRLAIEVRLQ